MPVSPFCDHTQQGRSHYAHDPSLRSDSQTLYPDAIDPRKRACGMAGPSAAVMRRLAWGRTESELHNERNRAALDAAFGKLEAESLPTGPNYTDGEDIPF
jgi:hypothetical protein